jgi:hypothetical protein
MNFRNIAWYLFLALIFLNILGCSGTTKDPDDSDITIENKEMRLVFGSDGTALSLIH